MELYGAVEAGGTKTVCAVGLGPDQLVAEISFPTTTPEETIGRLVSFFQEQLKIHTITTIGMGTFGPIDLNPSSATYGYITSTPKPGWRMTNIRGELYGRLGIPVAFDTDVDTAALGEYTWGAAQGLDNFLYLTIGTGIGGGGFANGKLMHGLIHPEMGHMLIPHDRAEDPFPGSCPFHGDCFEGLASGPAVERRWGQPGETLPPEHPAWLLESEYIARAMANLICMASPQRIIVGGGVMHQKGIIDNVRRLTQKYLNGYIQSGSILNNIAEYIVLPGLGNRSGILGAVALAQEFSAINAEVTE